MDIAINTDILRSTGSPEMYLRLIAEAGFTHLHWCHQWNTDFLYSAFEIAQHRKWLERYGLKLLDIHGSAGMEKQWFSPDEYCRRSGVELVMNRVVMLRELGVTSLRLVVASRGVVVPASWWGKIKTTTQIVSVVVILMEPAFGDFGAKHILSYIFLALMTVATVGSGADYLHSLWPYVSGKK